MPGQFGLNASRMDSSSAHTTTPVPFIEGHLEKDIRRLRPA
jgi:hypothetical protein